MRRTPGAENLLKQQTGLTLVETLIALAIFSIGILGVAQLQLWNIKNNTTGNITTQATMLAQEKVEELKNVADPGDIVDGNDAPAPNFTREWEATPSGACAGCEQLEVRVTYTGRGQSREINLTTILR